MRMYCCMSSMCLYEAKYPDTTDPEYIRITKLIENLRSRGIIIERAAWDTDQSICRIIDKNGEKILPLVVTNNFIMITGRYPTDGEIKQILHMANTSFERKTRGLGSCAIPGYEFDE